MKDRLNALQMLMLADTVYSKNCVSMQRSLALVVSIVLWLFGTGSDMQLECICDKGLTGDVCCVVWAEIDYCESEPCINDGECMDTGTGYTCVCPEGYTGTNCETGMSAACVAHMSVQQSKSG